MEKDTKKRPTDYDDATIKSTKRQSTEVVSTTESQSISRFLIIHGTNTNRFNHVQVTQKQLKLLNQATF